MVFSIARSTGWTEQTILWLPLKRALQYLHCHWISEGLTTDWRSSSAERLEDLNQLYNRLKHLTRP